jgi:hypothetical protein
MRSIPGGRAPETSRLASARTSASGRRGRGWSRRKLKGNGLTLVLGPESPACPDPAGPRQHKVAKAVQNLVSSCPENIESLANYKPRSKTYSVSLTFSGEACSVMSKLMAELKVDNPNEVIKPALSLLISALGKEILLRDPKTGIVDLVEF